MSKEAGQCIGRASPESPARIFRVRIAIRTFGELLITGGVFLLLFLVWQLWWTDVEANAKSEDIL